MRQTQKIKVNKRDPKFFVSSNLNEQQKSFFLILNCIWQIYSFKAAIYIPKTIVPQLFTAWEYPTKEYTKQYSSEFTQMSWLIYIAYIPNRVPIKQNKK